MARIAATTTVEQTTEVQLTPQLKRKLLTALRTYALKVAEMKSLKTWIEDQKGAVEKLFIEARETDALVNGTDIDGFRVKMVFPTSSKLDQKRLMELCPGLTPELLQEATTVKPGKPYVKVTVPGADDQD